MKYEQRCSGCAWLSSQGHAKDCVYAEKQSDGSAYAVDNGTGWEIMKPPKILDAIADKVLSHKPKPKSKPARKRVRRAKKLQPADV